MIGQTLELWFLRVISVLGAVSLWFYVVNSEPIEIEHKLPLKIQTVSGFARTNQVPTEILVRFKGPRTFMKNISQSKANVKVKVGNPQIDRKSVVSITPEEIPLPFGVEIVDFSPKEIEISWDKEIKKYVPLRPQLVGELAKELKFSSQLKNKEVLISGARSVLKNIGRVNSRAVDISVLEGKGEMVLTYDETDPRIEIEPQEGVLMNYEILPNRANYTLKNIPIRFITSNSRFSADRQKVSMDVLIFGEGAQIRENQVRVIADIPEDSRGKISVPLRVELPEGVHLVKINPESIIINLR